MKSFRIFFALILITASCGKVSTREVEKETGTTKLQSGMVVADHPEAVRIGTEILNKGGNAVDAAIAVQFALAVCYPYAGSLGVGGFMIIRQNNGEFFSLDFRETAPAKATRDMYLGANEKPIPNKSVEGHFAVAVPGMVDGMVKSHEKFGKLRWEELVEPSLLLAKNGFPVSEMQAQQFNEEAVMFNAWGEENNYLFKEQPWKTGDLLVQKDLANCLERIRDHGRAGFYEGETAGLIVAEMKRAGGWISLEDLKNYEAKWREPLAGNYKEYKIISMGPPSSGGILLLQMLRMANHCPVKNPDRLSPEWIHWVVEAERRAFADRSQYLGDPDFTDVPINSLLDSLYLQKRISAVTNHANAFHSDSIFAGELHAKESDETTHYSIVDSDGNAVSVTSTLNAAYGSHVFVKGAGILLNNEMDDFSSQPGVPNMYGMIGAEANKIEAGKRPLSSMTPVIIEKNGELFFIAGGPGGSTIPTSVMLVFLNVAKFGMTPQDAVAAKRYHHQWKPDWISIEKDAFTEAIKDSLTRRGYILKEREPIGDVLMIIVHDDGRVEAGVDPRRGGTAGLAR